MAAAPLSWFLLITIPGALVPAYGRDLRETPAPPRARGAGPVALGRYTLGRRGVSLTLLVRSGELGEPCQSGVFCKPCLRTYEGGEGGEPIATVIRQVLDIELAEPFLFAEPVELGGMTAAARWSAGLVNWA